MELGGGPYAWARERRPMATRRLDRADIVTVET